MARTLTRRQALAAGAAGVAAALVGGAGLVQAGVVPGRYRAGRLLGACDLGGLPPTTVAPGPLRFASFPSQRRRRRVGYGVAWPPGSGLGDRLGVCLLLHAAAGDQRRRHPPVRPGLGRRPRQRLAPRPRRRPLRHAPGRAAAAAVRPRLHTGPGQVAVLGWSMGAAGACGWPRPP